MVKRYEWDWGDGMNEAADGPYVLASDYDALAAAARKVTCSTCKGAGRYRAWVHGAATEEWADCPDCTDLRKLLEGER